jgi:hypothetical protein
MIEGAMLGLAAAVLALLLLGESHRFAADRLSGVLFLGPSGILLFLFLGGALGAGGTLLSLRRYLRMQRA